jgi:cell division protein FtsB
MGLAQKSPLQQHASGRVWAVRTLLLVLLMISGYLVFEFGRISAGYDVVDIREQRKDNKDHVDALDDEISGLRQEVALLKTHRAVDREAYSEIEASLLTLQAKIQEQQDAIAFYRGIVSPSDGKAGLRVQDLRLTRGRDERQFNVRLVLVQAMKHDRKVSGDVKMTVQGSQDGVETTLAFADLADDKTDLAWAYSFRYFQDFDRQLVLPDGFTPERINVEVHSRTRSISSIEESFVWAIG